MVLVSSDCNTGRKIGGPGWYNGRVCPSRGFPHLSRQSDSDLSIVKVLSKVRIPSQQRRRVLRPPGSQSLQSALRPRKHHRGRTRARPAAASSNSAPLTLDRAAFVASPRTVPGSETSRRRDCVHLAVTDCLRGHARHDHLGINLAREHGSLHHRTPRHNRRGSINTEGYYAFYLPSRHFRRWLSARSRRKVTTTLRGARSRS